MACPRAKSPKDPKIPLARLRRSPQPHRCPLWRIDICIRPIFPAPVVAIVFHARRAAKHVSFRGPRNIPCSRRDVSIGASPGTRLASKIAHERRNARPARSNAAFARAIEHRYPMPQARGHESAYSSIPRGDDAVRTFHPGADAIERHEIRSERAPNDGKRMHLNVYTSMWVGRLFADTDAMPTGPHGAPAPSLRRLGVMAIARLMVIAASPGSWMGLSRTLSHSTIDLSLFWNDVGS